MSPRIWVSFSDIGVVDTDGDGLPNNVEGEIGTDPGDPFNLLPSGTVGDRYGPVDFLPITPPDTQLDVDSSTLPPGLRLENGRLVGTPTEAGTYDIAFIVTMPGGAEFTSIRRVVIDPLVAGAAEARAGCLIGPGRSSSARASPSSSGSSPSGSARLKGRPPARLLDRRAGRMLARSVRQSAPLSARSSGRPAVARSTLARSASAPTTAARPARPAPRAPSAPLVRPDPWGPLVPPVRRAASARWRDRCGRSPAVDPHRGGGGRHADPGGQAPRRTQRRPVGRSCPSS